MTESQDIIDQRELLKLLTIKEQELKYNKFARWFPDEGKYRRELYPKHIQFFNATKDHSQIAFIAANRVGKTQALMYAFVMHLTGKYPDWYEGRRFLNPIDSWLVGTKTEKTRDILQKGLVGRLNDMGTGMLPKENILHYTRKAGSMAEAIDTLYVKHSSGGISTVAFKSYAEGFEGFAGDYIHLIGMDEEPPPSQKKIYTECLTRTMNDNEPGIVMCTFTPLYCLTDLVLSFMPYGKMPPNGVPENNPDKFVVQVGWDDVPHLTEAQKEKIKAEYSPHEIDARTKGDPSMTSGRIYTVPETDIKVDPFPIPSHWLKVYGMDFGKRITAAVWGALDPETDILYIYAEYYGKNQPLAVNASAIRQRSDGIIGVIDPAATQGNIVDGTAILDLYRLEGLDLELAARHLVETGLANIQHRLETGRCKIFSTCTNFFNEYNVYARDEEGKIVKKDDHLMDAWRYMVTSGLHLASPSTSFLEELKEKERSEFGSGKRSRITGY